MQIWKNGVLQFGSLMMGTDLLDTLVKQTGLTKEDLLARLAKTLPEAVDKLTPDGKVPA